jgi:hypothetical protein
MQISRLPKPPLSTQDGSSITHPEYFARTRSRARCDNDISKAAPGPVPHGTTPTGAPFIRNPGISPAHSRAPPPSRIHPPRPKPIGASTIVASQTSYPSTLPRLDRATHRPLHIVHSDYLITHTHAGHWHLLHRNHLEYAPHHGSHGCRTNTDDNHWLHAAVLHHCLKIWPPGRSPWPTLKPVPRLPRSHYSPPSN